MENGNKIPAVNLAELLAPRYSINSEGVAFEWTCSHCTKGHFIVIIVAMILTYVIQLLAFIMSLAFLRPQVIVGYKIAALTQPFFESFQMVMIVFVVHFQFHAFYVEPFKILNLISKHLFYTNITVTILTSSILLSFDYDSDHFTQIYQMNTMLMLLILMIFSYYKLRRYLENDRKPRFRQILGFNVLCSFSIPLVVIELGEAIFRVSSFYNDLAMTVPDRVCLFLCFYFTLGCVSVFLLRDVYLGFGFFINLFGVLVLQSVNICQDYEDYCSVVVQVLAGVFAALIGVEILDLVYRFPRIHFYDYSIKRF